MEYFLKVREVTQGSVPHLTTEQMREVDRLMMEEYGIALLQMMENAGRNLAEVGRGRFLDGDPRGRRVLVLAGGGGNGGGGMAAARRLHNWGANVDLFLSSPDCRLGSVPRQQLEILRHLGIPAYQGLPGDGLPPADLIVDAVIGYSLRGAPTGDAASLIRAANEHPAPALSLDVPSGLDSTTGEVHDPTIRASATMTLALPKTGLSEAGARDAVGELYLSDISVPPELYASPTLAIEVGPIFATSDIVRLTPS